MPAARTRAWSSWYLSTVPRVRSRVRSSIWLRPERGQGRRPVDRLGHPGRLVEVLLPQRLDGGRHLAGRVRARLGGAQPDDGHLPLEVRVLDPVVQAAPLEGVVDVAGAVGGDDDQRRLDGPEGAELGDGHRVLRQELEEEGLELVVGAVDLVDEQDRRRAPATWSMAGQQRPADEEPLAVDARPRSADRRRLPRRRAGGAAGGRSPTRRPPGRRRCPRSTAGAAARRPSSAASTLATSVLPTPASPSRSSGRCRARARKIDVASPSSAR